VSDIDTVPVDSLKALDPDRPIREADMRRRLALIASARRPIVGKRPAHEESTLNVRHVVPLDQDGPIWRLEITDHIGPHCRAIDYVV